MCLSQAGLSDCEGATKYVSPEVGIEGRMGFSAGEGTRCCGRKVWCKCLLCQVKRQGRTSVLLPDWEVQMKSAVGKLQRKVERQGVCAQVGLSSISYRFCLTTSCSPAVGAPCNCKGDGRLTDSGSYRGSVQYVREATTDKRCWISSLCSA